MALIKTAIEIDKLLANINGSLLLNAIITNYKVDNLESPRRVSFPLPTFQGQPYNAVLIGKSLPSLPTGWISPDAEGSVKRLEIKSAQGKNIFRIATNKGESGISLGVVAGSLQSGNLSPVVNSFLSGENQVESKVNVNIENFPAITKVTLDKKSMARVAIGNAAGNVIIGNKNRNRLVGNEGPDVLTGKQNADIFDLGKRPDRLKPQTMDKITDFSGKGGEGDRILINLSRYQIASGTTKTFKSFETTAAFGELLRGAAAKSNEDFVFNQQTGILYWNENGSANGLGAGGALVRLNAIAGDVPELTTILSSPESPVVQFM